jgi:hypothetical protein
MKVNVGDRIWLVKQLWLAEQYDYDMKQPILFEVIEVDGIGFHRLKRLDNNDIICYGELRDGKWIKETIDLFQI